MKRFLVFSLILAMALSLSLYVYADDTTSSSVNVTYEVSGTYYVTIPASVSIAAGTGQCTFDVSCSENHTGKNFQIGVSSNNANGIYWRMLNGSSEIGYTMTAQYMNNGSYATLNVDNGGTMPLAFMGTTSVILTLDNNDLKRAVQGTYSDTINFTITPIG